MPHRGRHVVLATPEGPFTAGGRGPTTRRANRTVFYNATVARGLRPHDYPAPLDYERVRLDCFDRYDIPPLLAEVLEQAPGANPRIGDQAFARGCGHWTEFSYASGLCPPCILRNSLDSAASTSVHAQIPDRWVLEYATRALKAPPDEALKHVNGSRWYRSLTGDLTARASNVGRWSLLADTPRERMACAMRAAEVFAVRATRAHDTAPPEEQAALLKERDNWLRFSSEAHSALNVMSTTVLESDVQARINAFLNTPIDELLAREDVELKSDCTAAEFETLHEIRYKGRKKRLDILRKRREQPPPQIWPLRATLPLAPRDSLDDIYLNDEFELSARNTDGLRLYNAVLAAHDLAQQRAQQTPAERAREEIYTDSLRLERSRTPTPAPEPARRQTARRGRLRVADVRKEHVQSRSRSRSASSAEPRSGDATPAEAGQESGRSSATILQTHPEEGDAETPGPPVLPDTAHDLNVGFSPPRSEIPSTVGGLHDVSFETASPYCLEAAPSKTPSIVGDDQAQELYDKHFKNKPLPVATAPGQTRPNRPPIVKRIARNDKADQYYFRAPTNKEYAHTAVQPAYEKSEETSFSAWARCSFTGDEENPCYAPSQILSLAHVTQVGSMKVRQNAQNQHDNETGTGPGGERPIRYQTDFHPVALEMIAHQDATRKRDLDNVEDGNYPPAHCPSLPGGLMERGSFEVDGTRLSCYGYVKPDVAYTGCDTRIDDETWLSTTPLAMQQMASLTNCALSQNNTMQYACDNVMAQMEAQRQQPTHTIDPLHIYLSQVVRHLQTVLTCQTAQLSAAAQHAKYMFRDALTRCCDPETRRAILTQPLLQGDVLWEPIEQAASIQTFEQLMRDENLRAAPAPVPRLITEKDRNDLHLASQHPIWGEEKYVYDAYNSILTAQRLAYANRTAKRYKDDTRIRNPDSRRYSRSKQVIDMQQYFKDPLKLAPDAETVSEVGERGDEEWPVPDDASEEEKQLSTSDYSTDDEGETQDGSAAQKRKKRRTRRKQKLSTRIPAQEADELLAAAGSTVQPINTGRPLEIDIKEAYRLLGVVPENEKRYYQQALALVVQRGAEIRSWDRVQAAMKERIKDKKKGVRIQQPRAAKSLLEVGHYGLIDPADREIRAQLGLEERKQSSMASGVPQDLTEFAPMEIKVKTRRTKARKPKRAPGERKYRSLEEREKAVFKRRRERMELAKRMKEELFPQAAVKTIAKALMMGESGSEESPPSADDFERTIALTTGVPAAVVAPRVSKGDQPGTSGTQSKHRHDDEPDEVIRFNPRRLAGVASETESSLEDDVDDPEGEEEGPNEYESSAKSSHDTAESDATVKEEKLSESSTDSQVSDGSDDGAKGDDEDGTGTKTEQSDAAQTPAAASTGDKKQEKQAPAPAEQEDESKAKPQKRAPRRQKPPAQQPATTTSPEPSRSPPVKRARRSSRLQTKTQETATQQEAPSTSRATRASRARQHKM